MHLAQRLDELARRKAEEEAAAEEEEFYESNVEVQEDSQDRRELQRDSHRENGYRGNVGMVPRMSERRKGNDDIEEEAVEEGGEDEEDIEDEEIEDEEIEDEEIEDSMPGNISSFFSSCSRILNIYVFQYVLDLSIA